MYVGWCGGMWWRCLRVRLVQLVYGAFRMCMSMLLTSCRFCVRRHAGAVEAEAGGHLAGGRRVGVVGGGDCFEVCLSTLAACKSASLRPCAPAPPKQEAGTGRGAPVLRCEQQSGSLLPQGGSPGCIAHGERRQAAGKGRPRAQARFDDLTVGAAYKVTPVDMGTTVKYNVKSRSTSDVLCATTGAPCEVWGLWTERGCVRLGCP